MKIEQGFRSGSRLHPKLDLKCLSFQLATLVIILKSDSLFISRFHNMCNALFNFDDKEN